MDLTFLTIMVPVFVIVGAVVSLDVAGLTLVQAPKFEDQNRSNFIWALSNAGWHAGLLLIYIFAISIVFNFSIGFVEWLERVFLAFPEYLNDVVPYAAALLGLLKEHARIILGVFALLIVWNTYSGKIISKPELGGRDELPILAKTIFDILELLYKVVHRKAAKPGTISEFLTWQAQVALVAIDMLALAALMKSMGFLDSFLNQVTIIAAVFITVLTFAWFSGVKGRRAYKKFKNQAENHGDVGHIAYRWVIISMRMLEPLLIFYFALVLVAYLIFGSWVQSTGFLFGSLLLVLALISRHSFLKIVASAISEDSERNDSETKAVVRQFKDIAKDIIELGRVVLKYFVAAVATLLILIALVWLMYSDPSDVTSLDSVFSVLLAVSSGVLILPFFYNPRWIFANRVQSIRDKLVCMLASVHANRYAYLMILGALMSISIMPVFEEIIKDGWGVLEPSHMHVAQAGIWLVFLFVIGLMMDYLDNAHKIDKGKQLLCGGMPTDFGKLYAARILGFSSLLLFCIAWFQNQMRVAYFGLGS